LPRSAAGLRVIGWIESIFAALRRIAAGREIVKNPVPVTAGLSGENEA
jgi:hypothetical protein